MRAILFGFWLMYALLPGVLAGEECAEHDECEDDEYCKVDECETCLLTPPDLGCDLGNWTSSELVCCPAPCGTCGGAGCNTRPCKSYCCQSYILGTERDCREVGAPCAIYTECPDNDYAASGFDFIFGYEPYGGSIDSDCKDYKFGCNGTPTAADAFLLSNITKGGVNNTASLQTTVRLNSSYENGCGSSGYRAESSTIDLKFTKFGNGEHWVVTFSVYLLDWDNTTEEDDDTHEDIFQLKQLSSVAEGPIQIVVQHNRFHVRDRTKTNNPQTDVGEIKKNTWFDFKVDVEWSNGTDGLILVDWREGNGTWDQVVNTTGRNFNDLDKRGYLKWGLYKANADDFSDPQYNQVFERKIIHDEITVERIA